MKIGIIGAMEAEIKNILSHLSEISESVKAGMVFTEGKIGNIDAVIVRSGVGKVNAALCAQILIDCFHITHLINSGIAGSLNNDIEIGDVVVSTDAVMHDMDATAFGYAAGETPGMRTCAFEADQNLRTMITDAIRAVAPKIHVFEGRIATGDQFISDSQLKNRIRKLFGAECTEMEGAAIAQAAFVNGIPFVIVRYISDKADESTLVPYQEFEAEAAANSANLIISVLKHFSEQAVLS